MNSWAELYPSLVVIAPELILAVGAMVLLMYGVFRGDRATPSTAFLAVLLMAAAGYFVVAGAGEAKALAFGGTFVSDAFARFLKVLILAGSALTLLMSLEYLAKQGIARFEYPVLIVLATLGMLIMVSANDLIVLYVGLEMQSLSLYVLASFSRDQQRSTEAGLKYFVLGALSSGMLLYGASLVYGFAGTTGFADIAAALDTQGAGLGILVGIVFVLAGLAFKVSAVPFHMWTPDVYEGAPTPVTAFFAAAPKVAAMGLFLRTVFGAFEGAEAQWMQIILVLSVASMALGAFGAIGQTNIKRLMAYSSIGHVGFMLVGFAAASEAGVQGILIYLSIYVAMTVGVFVCILAMQRQGQMVETIDDLSGLAQTNPGLAAALLILMFSMIGIPPFAGFWAKFYVFLAAVEAKLYWLAVLGFLSSCVGAYYYLRIIKVAYMDPPRQALDKGPGQLNGAILVLSVAFVCLFILWPAPLIEAAGAAAKSLVN